MPINNPSAASGGWTLITEETLAVDGTFDVTGITDEHTHLMVIMQVRGNVVATNKNYRMYANADFTEANYRRGQHQGGSVVANTGADTAQVSQIPGSTAPADTAGLLQIFIPFYTGTVFHKMFFSMTTERRDATEVINANYNVYWEDTSAITRFTFRTSTHPADEIEAGSQMQLWGLG